MAKNRQHTSSEINCSLPPYEAFILTSGGCIFPLFLLRDNNVPKSLYNRILLPITDAPIWQSPTPCPHPAPVRINLEGISFPSKIPYPPQKPNYKDGFQKVSV